jgi:hypothetical protein
MDKRVKEGSQMGRGKAFHHKKKGHEPQSPQNSLAEKHTKERIEDEEYIVTQEAFKNRVGMTPEPDYDNEDMVR